MQVQFKNGLFSVTAENKSENEILFGLINGQTSKEKEIKTIQDSKKAYKPRQKREAVECPVEGCEAMVKNPSIHMRQKHGVDNEGNVHETFTHNISGVMPVHAPVVKLPNGTFKLRKKGGLLG